MTSSSSMLEIREFDGAGNLTATYVESATDKLTPARRVDVIPPNDTKSSRQKFLDIFLPVGFPHTVTEDYLEYQIYDSLQAFASSIASLLSSRAVLSTVGVGDSSASPTAALLLSILQESLGRIATIAFAHRLGTALEPECKLYRLLADVLNDAAFLLDCLSPALPRGFVRVLVLSTSSVLRALCGVAAGSAKASLSAHFARAGENLGELNAKDSSQETIISLLGLLVGSVVVTHVVSRTATWSLLVGLLAVHLETNRRAVRAVRMRVMNRQRAALVWHCLRQGRVPSLEQISREERIFEWDGVLRGRDGGIVGHCTIGASIGRLAHGLADANKSTGAVSTSGTHLSTIMDLYADAPYVLWSDGHPALEQYPMRLLAVLKKDASKRDLLVAWWQALIISCAEKASMSQNVLDTFRQSRREALALLEKYEVSLKDKGWNIDGSVLETVAGTRITVGG